jgi:hypothetical protein
MLGIVAVAAAPAAATTQSASSGSVTATFSFSGSVAPFSSLRLAISRSGVTVYDQTVSSKACSSLCWPASATSPPSVRVVDLDREGEPEVVLDLYTGGAHCCSVTQVFRWNPGRGTYDRSERNWGDPGATLSDLRHDGRVEFKSADDRFAFTFAPFAYSGLPVQIWRYDAGRFIDITRSFPASVAADAKQWLKRYDRNRKARLGLGFLAAWAADEQLLGKRGLVTSTLNHELRRGHLTGLPGWTSGRRYVRRLLKFLRHAGIADVREPSDRLRSAGRCGSTAKLIVA